MPHTTPSNPPILGLPPEIHLLIIDLLLFPDTIHLKISCSYFYDLIPPLTHKDLLQSETTDFAIQKGIYACRYCLRLREASEFADRMLHHGRGRFGLDSAKRFCVECGLAPREGEARYGPGAQIEIQGIYYVICNCCRKFGLGVKDKQGRGSSECKDCWAERSAEEEMRFHHEMEKRLLDEDEGLRAESGKFLDHGEDESRFVRFFHGSSVS